jgi:hypothetical protein
MGQNIYIGWQDEYDVQQHVPKCSVDYRIPFYSPGVSDCDNEKVSPGKLMCLLPMSRASPGWHSVRADSAFS